MTSNLGNSYLNIQMHSEMSCWYLPLMKVNLNQCWFVTIKTDVWEGWPTHGKETGETSSDRLVM